MSASIVELSNVAAVDPLLIDVRAAAKQLSISARSLWTLTRDGKIPCVRLGRRVLYSPKALEAWVTQQQEVTK